MNFDKYFGRVYHIRNYNCAHLVVEAGTDVFGPRIGEMLRAYLCAPSERKSKLSDLKLGRWLKKPVDPCVVLFQAPGRIAHVGLFYKGKVLHINERGVQYQPLDVVSFGYPKVRFFTCN